MLPEEVVEIHLKLWHNPPPHKISYRGEKYVVHIADEPTKNFRSVAIGNISIVTQNLRKASPNTTWVQQNPHNKLSWVFKDGNYAGKVETSEKTKVYTLNPTKLIHTQ